MEYIHGCTYVHADLKGANILLGQGKSGAHQAYLVDFGLVSHYTSKDFKPDPKKMHNGTIEYTSRDAHNGVPTMRSDLEILAYNVVHWSGTTLPWEADGLLAQPKKVQESKEQFMSNVDVSLKKCFPSCPGKLLQKLHLIFYHCDVATTKCFFLLSTDAIIDYFKYVATLKYNDTPNYEKCRQIFETGLKKLGEKNSGELNFNVKSVAAAPSKKETVKPSKVGDKSPRKRVTKPATLAKIDSDPESEAENKSPTKVPRKRGMAAEAIPRAKEKRAKIITKIDDEKPSTSKTGSTVVINDLPANDKTKSKVLHLNLELDVSIDANIVLSVKRKIKSEKVKSESQTKSIPATATDDDDEDVIPNSNENTPVAKVRVYKSKNGTTKRATRKSPRAVL